MPRKRVSPDKLRELGRPDEGTALPAAPRTGANAALAATARAVLEQEFERALALKEKLAAEGGERETGRARQAERLRSLVASLEGANRFALAMGLITPAESRELFAAAMKRGLYEGWR